MLLYGMNTPCEIERQMASTQKYFTWARDRGLLSLIYKNLRN